MAKVSTEVLVPLATKDCIREVTRPLVSILALIVLLRFSAKPNKEKCLASNLYRLCRAAFAFSKTVRQNLERKAGVKGAQNVFPDGHLTLTIRQAYYTAIKTRSVASTSLINGTGNPAQSKILQGLCQL